MGKNEALSHHDVEKLNETLARKNVAYLFIGKGAAVLHGFPDTTQDVDIFPRKDTRNTQALIEALTELGFAIDNTTAEEITRGKDFVQLRSGPFDVDLVFAPDGIESFDDAWRRGVRIERFPVCGLDDIIESKRQAGRAKDRETLPRLEHFRAWAKAHTRGRTQALGKQPRAQETQNEQGQNDRQSEDTTNRTPSGEPDKQGGRRDPALTGTRAAERWSHYKPRKRRASRPKRVQRDRGDNH